MSKLFVLCCIVQAQNVPLLLLSYVLLCFKLQRIGLLAMVDAYTFNRTRLIVATVLLSLPVEFTLLLCELWWDHIQTRHCGTLLVEDNFAINHFAHFIAVQKNIWFYSYGCNS